MDEINSQNLLAEAAQVLTANDRGGWTVPAGELYPHQWLWDSCFIAIGLAHLDIERAQKEIKNLLRGQWSNGMVPHIIFEDSPEHRREHKLWQSWLNPHAPNGLLTTGITQPPMLAEAAVRIGQKMKLPERRSWYRQIYPHLLKYHQWIYEDRVVDGLAMLLHPYESGFDNSPYWAIQLRLHAWPWWLKLAEKTGLDKLAELFRRDTKHLNEGQRASNAEGIADWALLRRLRSRAYESREILQKPKLEVADLAFNCILIRANTHLRGIAKTLGEQLPEELVANMKHTEASLNNLWDEQSGLYFSGDALEQHLILEPTISTLLPLYAGCIPRERAEHLVGLLGKRSQYKVSWPIPSVPQNSGYFNPERYWQGPTWVNTNWLIIDGLKQYGFLDEAEAIKEKTLLMVGSNDSFEYFNPLNGQGQGAPNFSWTAALVIDMLKA